MRTLILALFLCGCVSTKIKLPAREPVPLTPTWRQWAETYAPHEVKLWTARPTRAVAWKAKEVRLRTVFSDYDREDNETRLVATGEVDLINPGGEANRSFRVTWVQPGRATGDRWE